ncbi:DUF4376 domain-containing protein [Pseudomonas caspiana]|uniref:DUF4376 domain-containing protein n=1 Tax=Pseudomonas caspiana TaxID=1451454 RepID=A0A1Y3PCD5_9PSED|nr:DUF4376 domain-containing protein [Pseudomonas caspiana]OUM74454.1 hypothetical protein AUC60_06795 [Pseudomonas caspiana]
MKYVTCNQAGEITGRYDSDFHRAIPKDAIVIPDKVWLATITETDGLWRLGADGVVSKQPFVPVAPNYPALISAERYAREASGVLVDGLLIETTRDSQSLISGMAVSALMDSAYRCNFKTGLGFVELGAAQILSISSAVRAHVQACFDREKVLLELVSAGTYSVEQLYQGWPDYSEPEPETKPETEVSP